MRKLFLLLLFFIATIMALVVIFRAVLPVSQDIIIEAHKPSVVDTKIDSNLQRWIQSSFTQKLADTLYFSKLVNLISETYPALDSNPNIHIHHIADSSILTIKWIGRNDQLVPHIWIQSPTIESPMLSTIHLWDYDPMMGKINPPHVYGSGASSEKAIIAAQLSAIEQLIIEGFLNERTLYLIYPQHFNHLDKIWAWFTENNQPIEHILFTSPGIQMKDTFLNAYIGVEQSRVFHLNQENKNNDHNLPAEMSKDNPMYRYIHHSVNQKTSFADNIILKNEWLLGAFSQQIISTFIHLNRYLPYHKKYEGHQTFFTMDQSIPSSLIEHCKEPFEAISSSIESPAYSLIQRTVLQSFPNVQTYPSFYAYNASLQTAKQVSENIYFFSPALLSHQNEYSFETVNEKVHKDHLHRSAYFYRQYVKNSQN